MLFNKLYIHCTKNNTIFSFIQQNKTYITKSCGYTDIKGAKRSTKHATQELFKSLKLILKENKEVPFILVFSGFNKSRSNIVTFLKESEITLIKIIDATKTQHNGCRLKKKRRI
jgi:small subunit ribosomal protein S11